MKRFELALWICLAAGVLTAGCAGEDGTDGVDGEDGTGGDPSISAITPNAAFLDRTITVTISGNATEWTSAATVDFGAGIMVDNLIVASPTAIVADITIGEDAATGRRDIAVSDGGVALSYEGAFDVSAPLAFEAFEGPSGTLAQGSVMYGRLRLLDVSTPFDTNYPDVGYPYLSADAGAGTSAIVQAATPYTMDVLFMLDVNVAAGAADAHAFSDDSAQGTTSLAPDAFTIAARTPTPLSIGGNAGTAGDVLASTLYSFTPAAQQIVTITATSTDPDAQPEFFMLPPSGSFADRLDYSSSATITTATADPIYVVFWDSSGASGYTYDLEVTSLDSDEDEPNDTCATAQAVGSLPNNLSGLALSSATDEDWFAVTVDASAMGFGFDVATSPGNFDTDTLIEVFSGTCGSLTPLGPASADEYFHENHLSAPITAAGTYFIKISNSPSGYVGSEYTLDISLALNSEVEPMNNSCAGATASTPGTIDGLALSSSFDQDWFQFTAAAGDVGSVVHVVTSAGDPDTDTVVEVFRGSCAALVSMGGPSSDGNYHENHTSTAITAAGSYWVQVSHSTYPFTGNEYVLTVSLE